MLTYLPPQVIMRRSLRARSDLDESHVASPELTAERARKVERFLMAYYALDIAAFGFTFTPWKVLHFAAAAWAILRIIDIVQVSVNVALFDRIRGREDSKVASRMRLTALAILNYFKLILCFSAIYATGFIGELKGASTPWDALYFSVLTQLTISFGDVTPLGGFRVVAAIQALAGLLFLVLIFARVISALPRIDEVIGQGPRHDA